MRSIVTNQLAVVSSNLYVILYQGKGGIGIVSAYDSCDHIGTHEDYEMAINEARKLAISHPGVSYIVTKIEEIISQSKKQNENLLSSVNAKLFGDYYEKAGAGTSIIKAARLLP